MHALIVRASEEAPEPNDVVAGWTGLVVFVALILAVAVIGFFLVRSLRRVDSAEEQGLYDHKPTGRADDAVADPAETVADPAEKKGD